MPAEEINNEYIEDIEDHGTQKIAAPKKKSTPVKNERYTEEKKEPVKNNIEPKKEEKEGEKNQEPDNQTA